MKTLNITFEEKDMINIEKVKKDHGGNWHDFILDLVRNYKKEVKDGKNNG